MLLDWSYYCDIMYKFSIRHWRGPPAAGSLIQCRKLHQLKTSAIVVASPSRHHVSYIRPSTSSFGRNFLTLSRLLITLVTVQVNSLASLAK